jgi:hypothetical protein
MTNHVQNPPASHPHVTVKIDDITVRLATPLISTSLKIHNDFKEYFSNPKDQVQGLQALAFLLKKTIKYIETPRGTIPLEFETEEQQTLTDMSAAVLIGDYFTPEMLNKIAMVAIQFIHECAPTEIYDQNGVAMEGVSTVRKPLSQMN